MSGKYSLILAILFSSVWAYGQSTRVSATAALLKSTVPGKADTAKAAALVRQGYNYLLKPGEDKADLEAAMKLAHRVLELGRAGLYRYTYNDARLLVFNVLIERSDLASAHALLPMLTDEWYMRALVLMGNFYFYQRAQFDSAAHYAQNANKLSIAAGRNKEMAQAQDLLIRCYMSKNDLPGAYKVIEEVKGPARIGGLLRLGNAWLYKIGEEKADLDHALHYYNEAKQAIDQYQATGWKKEYQNSMIHYYYEAGDTAKAKAISVQRILDLEKAGDKEGAVNGWRALQSSLYFTDSTWPTRLDCVQRIAAIYKEMKDDVKTIEADKDVADMHMLQGMLVLAEGELLNVLERFKAIRYPWVHYTYDLLRNVNRLKGNYDRALYYAIESVKSAKATGDTGLISEFYKKVAEIHYFLGNKAKYVEWNRMAVEANHDLTAYDKVYEQAGIMAFNGQVREAAQFLEAGIRKYPPANVLQQADVAYLLVYCFHEMKQYDKARQKLEEYIVLQDYIQAIPMQAAQIYYNIAQYYLSWKQYDEAEKYMQMIRGVPDQVLSVAFKRSVNEMEFVLDSAAGRYESAIRHLRASQGYSDSIFSENKSRQIEELQVKYETDKKDHDLLLKEQSIALLTRNAELQRTLLRQAQLQAQYDAEKRDVAYRLVQYESGKKEDSLRLKEKDILLLTRKDELKESLLQQAMISRNVIIGGSVMLVLLLALSYSRYLLKKRSNRQLQVQQQAISEQNTTLQKLLDEKEWLLKEIHHRVKNNLQIVMSLLNTQSAYLDNEAAIQAIQNSQQRMRAISLIHQKLYQSDKMAAITMSGYICELVEYLRDNFNAGSHVRFQTDVDLIELDVAQAVPVGLILNEAITNCIKYAFPGNRPGIISLSMKRQPDGQLELTIADNGQGLPAGFDSIQTDSLGMSLMQGLTRQLNGTFIAENREGAFISIVFRDEVIRQPDLD